MKVKRGTSQQNIKNKISNRKYLCDSHCKVPNSDGVDHLFDQQSLKQREGLDWPVIPCKLRQIQQERCECKYTRLFSMCYISQIAAMTTISCQYCTSKVFLLCCSNPPEQKVLNGVCDKCLVSIRFGSLDQQCIMCSDIINRELLEIKQKFIRIQGALQRGLSKDTNGPRMSCGNVAQLGQTSEHYGRQTQTILVKERTQNYGIFGSNQDFGSMGRQSGKSSFFTDTRIELTPDVLRQFNENAEVKIGSATRLSYERNKNRESDRNPRDMELEDRSVNFSDTSTYRDLQI